MNRCGTERMHEHFHVEVSAVGNLARGVGTTATTQRRAPPDSGSNNYINRWPADDLIGAMLIEVTKL